MKKLFFLAVLLSLSFVGYYFVDFQSISSNLITGEFSTSDTISSVADQGNVEVYFCPRDNCDLVLEQFIDSAQESIHCAFFELDLDNLRNLILEKSEQIDVRIVTDNQYLYEFNHSFVKTDTYGLMHNKFCIIDGKRVSTGSMNPTNNGAFKNNNNLLLIDSKILARNYQDEFNELWNGTFKKGDKVRNPQLLIGNTTVQNYFCPEDHCTEKVKEELRKAQKSVYFMTFSFTDDGIANVLLLKKLDGVDIKGVMEARQVTKYSVFSLLEYQGVDVVKDKNPANMHHINNLSKQYSCPKLGVLHHKVFVIDNKTVITGSFNPTNNGDKRNDENLLIIHSPDIARAFLDEFDCIWARNH